MAMKTVWALAALLPLSASSSAIAQQQPTNSPPPSSYPQSPKTEPSQRWAEVQVEPYHKHHDTRHGHDHVYPDRGSVIREVPRGALVVNYAGVSYRFSDGIWFEPRGPAYIVVAPPIGLVVQSVPSFATNVSIGKETFLYANDVYYSARPELGGYEVVNDPVNAALAAGPDVLTATPAPTASSASAAALAPAVAVPAAAIAATTAPASTAVPASAAVPATAAVRASATVPAGSAAVPGSAPVPAGSAAVPGSATVQAASGAAPVTAAVSTSPAVATSAPAPAQGALSASAAVPPTAATTLAAAPAVAAAAAPTPPAVRSSSNLLSGPPPGIFPYTYPKNGQTPDEQARDHYECYRFAVAQSGFDPMRASAGVPPADNAERQSLYGRAQKACLEGRGYTLR